MASPDPTCDSRIEREVEREREERQQNDEARIGVLLDDELRTKDARDNAQGSALQRGHSH